MFLKKFADALLIEIKINNSETKIVFNFIKYYCSIFQVPLAEATMSLELKIAFMINIKAIILSAVSTNQEVP